MERGTIVSLATRTPFIIGNAPFYTALLLVAVIWYLIGRLVSGYALQHATELGVRNDTQPAAGVVRIDGVRNGDIAGTVDGDVRLFLGEDVIVTDEEGAFRVPATALLTNEIGVIIPEGMKFVASKKGARYYPVFSSQGQRIVPENRVYFRSAEQAEIAGFRS